MHCNVCDRQLGENEISWNSDLEAYDPCMTCMAVILDAAFGSNQDQDQLEFTFLIDTEFDEHDSRERTPSSFAQVDPESFGDSDYD